MTQLHPQAPTRPDLLRRRLLLLLASLAAAPVWAEPAFDLAALMQSLAQVKAGEATFTEKRTSSLLDRPLELSGRLSFEAPDTFIRETLKPRQERMAVVGNQMTMSLGSRSRTVPVDSVAEASIIIEAMRGTLTGNRESLEKHFTVSVTGTSQRWFLELVPREPRLREQISMVRLHGQHAVVREVTIAMTDGDRSVMTIEPIVAASKPTSSIRP